MDSNTPSHKNLSLKIIFFSADEGGANGKGLAALFRELPDDAAVVRLPETNKKTLHRNEGF